MSEPIWDEKAFLRASKYMEALESEIQGLHFWCWRRELQETDDDDLPDDDSPPPGWQPTRAN